MYSNPLKDECELKLTKGRLLLLCVLGALDALSSAATEDRQVAYGEGEFTELTTQDCRVLLRFETLIERYMEKILRDAVTDVRVGQFKCSTAEDIRKADAIEPGVEKCLPPCYNVPPCYNGQVMLRG